MELDVNGDVVAEPKADDIAHAVDGQSGRKDWYLQLTRPDGFYLELVPDDDGLYKLANGNDAQKIRHLSEVAIEPDQAKDILTDFLSDGDAWRALWSRSRGDKRATKESKTGKTTYSPGAMEWIGGVAALTVPLTVYLQSWTVFLVCVALLIALLIGFKARQEIQVRFWPKVAGAVTKSAIQPRRQRFGREPTRLDNIPDVEYRFRVGAASYVGVRIGLNTEYAGVSIEAMVRKYPVGALVQVAYNPKDPTECLLEPRANSAFLRQLLFIAAVPLAMALAIVYGAPLIAPWVLARFPQANVLHAVIAFTLALYMIGAFALSLARRPDPPSGAAETAGKIVVAEIEEVDWGNRSTGEMYREPYYQPTIEIAYSVRGLDYRQRMEAPGASHWRSQSKIPGFETVKGAARKKAEALLADYPVGRQLQVRYDPQNPAVATLASIAPMPQTSGWFGRTVLPPIAIAAVLAWGAGALGAF
ncbi:MAG TPA: DUF3592 domain-containing protein [Roseiarcus sp.]|nr:DUF3592 domain-containing protein [Roseiarcus sp.]